MKEWQEFGFSGKDLETLNSQGRTFRHVINTLVFSSQFATHLSSLIFTPPLNSVFHFLASFHSKNDDHCGSTPIW